MAASPQIRALLSSVSLLRAAAKGDLATIRALEQAKADLLATDKSGKTALMYAYLLTRLELVYVTICGSGLHSTFLC